MLHTRSGRSRMSDIRALMSQAQAQRPPVQLDRRRKAGSSEVAADEELSREEVIRRLRALEQPVTLFGEARADRSSTACCRIVWSRSSLQLQAWLCVKCPRSDERRRAQGAVLITVAR